MPSFKTISSSNQISNLITVDAAGDLILDGSSTVYELPYSDGSYSSTPVTIASVTLLGGSNISSLTTDASGNILGTAFGNGTSNGIVFEIQLSNGAYSNTSTVVASIASVDVEDPFTLVVGARGDLVGTTSYATQADVEAGADFVIPKINGSYAASANTTIPLTGPFSGIPIGGLVSDASGNLYGIARVSGATSNVIYEITNTATGYAPSPSLFYSAAALSSLTFDRQGDLFAAAGTNIIEFKSSGGTLSATSTVVATESSLGTFMLDAAGNIFTTSADAHYVDLAVTTFVELGGSVVEIPRTATGYGREITLTSFAPTSFTPTQANGYAVAAGMGPAGILSADSSGNLFDATAGGTLTLAFFNGTPSNVFELSNTGFATTPATATIADADSTTHTVSFGLDALAELATPLLASVNPANTLFIDASGSATLAAGQTAAVDDATGAVALTGSAVANETVAAGGGDFSFADSGGSGTIVAGAGNDAISLTHGGNWSVALGNGVDSVNAAGGNNTVITGHAGSQVNLGNGSNLVVDEGNDTVVAGSGVATVSADGVNDLVGGTTGTLTFIAGTGANTVIGGTGGTTLFGGTSGSTLMFSNGVTQYTGFGASDTIAGVAGSMTVQAGSGGGTFFGSSAGGNLITATTGNVTAIGGGARDVLLATGSSSNLFGGGAGAETLTGAGSTGTNTFFAGSDPETLVGGAGNTALVAGAGAALLQGGTGVTLFLLVAGMTAGASDTISGFDPSHDFVKLLGYSGDGPGIVPASTTSNGSATIALSDGTHITFAGVTQFASSSFT